jgi:RNA polymerase sigma factor (sigma-70 family)
VRDDPTVIALVERAASGDPAAWDELVTRYAPLVWAICRRYRLDRPDADDAAQGVWLRLVEQLPRLRDPAALPGWLSTTTARECLRVVRGAQRRQANEVVLPPDVVPDGVAPPPDAGLLAAERQALLREAYAQLPQRCRDLLGLLLAQPPLPYAQISAELAIPVGSIGPNRARCLETLRRHPALAALGNGEAGGGEAGGGEAGGGEAGSGGKAEREGAVR